MSVMTKFLGADCRDFGSILSAIFSFIHHIGPQNCVEYKNFQMHVDTMVYMKEECLLLGYY